MFFVLSKTVALALLPSNLIAILGLAGLLLMATRLRRAGLRLMATSVVLLIVAGVSPLANILTYALENRFPVWDPAHGAPDGIVILGGAIDANLSREHGVPVIAQAAERVIAIAKLARAYPKARIIYSSGDASLLGDEPDEAQFLLPVLDDLGVVRDRVTLERRSRNTAENAAFSKAIAKPMPGERWLLITSAQHMPRAIGCFRRVGFTVEAYPVAWRAPTHIEWPPMRIGENLVRLDLATKEWTGLLAYWLTGRTSSLFPSP
jgi:uncharacterized SAM-binding protein YcdF (DUF218 family)